MNCFDFNACFGHWPYWDLHQKRPDELIAQMDRCGIERAAVMSLRGLVVDWRRGNEETLAAARTAPARLVAAASLSPFDRGGVAELERLAAAGFRLLRLYPQFHSYSLASAFADEICDAAAARALPVMIPTRPMMNWRFAALPLDPVAALAGRHPRTAFVISGPNYLAEYQSLVELMRRSDNVYCEISALQGFGALARLVGDVGAGRVLFGTGALLHYPACNVAKLERAAIPEPARRAIARENALRLLGLDAC